MTGPRDDASPRVTVVVPAWNSGSWLPGCLDALRAQSFRDFALRVVDSGSTDGSIEEVTHRYPEAQILRLPRNRGFAAAANAGVARATGPYVALLNADTAARPDWLAKLVEALDASPADVGAVASKMLRMDRPDLVDDAGNTLSWYGSATKRGHLRPASEFDDPVEVFSVSAGAALYRREFFDAAGLFDEGFGSYFEDVDLGLRGRLLGFRYTYAPEAEVLHQGHGSNIARGRYVTQITRNRLATLIKNLPSRLLLRHWRTLLFGQLYFFVAYRRPLASLAGHLSFVWRLPRVLRQRKQLAARRTASVETLDGLLATDLGEPPLRELIRRKLEPRRAPA